MARWNVEVPTSKYYGPLPPNPRGIVSHDLQELIRELENTKEIAIDTETTGLIVWKERVLYWSLAWGNKRATLHIACLPHFKHIFQDPTKHWIFANAKFDMHMLAQMGQYIAGRVHCTQVMHSLLFEERSHKLKDMARHLLGWRWSDFEDTFGKIKKKSDKSGLEPEELIRKAEYENFPLLVEYAANDAWGTLGCYHDLRKKLQEALTLSLFRECHPYIENLWDLFYKVEAPYTKVLWKNERNGILIDAEYFAQIQPQARREIDEVERAICQRAGWLLNPDSDHDLRRYFFEQCRYPPMKMTSGGKSGIRQPSVDQSVLEHIDETYGDPVAGLVRQHSRLSKLYGTYIEGISSLVDPYNRIHTQFNQDIARCLPAGELVLTNRGYIPVEQVRIGDKVIAHTGLPRPVIETSTHRETPIYSVQLSNGLILRTTGNHEYKTEAGWQRADTLQVGHAVIVHSDAERWKTIRSWTEFEVSSWGRVRNRRTGNCLTPQPKNQWGHLKVCLHRNGAQRRGPDRKDVSVHRLVLKAFGKLGVGETRHLNGIAWDNTIGNLTSGTPKENRQDAVRHGSMSQRRAGRTILTESDVAAIRAAGSPVQPPSTTSKLTYEKAEEIRAAYQRKSRQELADEYGVSYVSVDNIVKGKTWSRPPSLKKTAEELAALYDVSPGTIRDIWAGRRWQPEDGIDAARASFGTATVVAVRVEPPEITYGLTVDQDHSHVTGGIVTHNTGRLSSKNPNLQNIPNVDKDKWRLRKAFIAPPGHCLLVCDYSQLEMRLLACASLEQDMIGIFLRNWDIHMGNASMMMNIPYDELKEAKSIDKQVKDGKMPESYMTARVLECLAARAAAKNIGFGLNYGMGAAKLAADLGVSRQEAEYKISLYKKTYPAVTRFYEEAIRETEQTGYAFTILGRRRNVPGIGSSRKDERAKAERIAVNTQIQGSAADVVKMAQILLDKSDIATRYECHSLLQVHDELVHQCPLEYADQARAEIKEWMEHPFMLDLAVPLLTETGKAQNWLEAK